ncbi:MAG: radical SAM protein [bacterium]|nr:radical SAM protein [bacterium]
MTEPDYDLRACIWELTLRCTMNCMHCGSSAGAARHKELTLNECLAVADELAALGCEELTLIGGEMFLYRGWEQIARRLTDAGVLVNIMTNGYHLQPKHLEQIKYANLANVGLSIDGMEENHNRIRRRPDGFAQVTRSIGLLRAEAVPVGVVTSLLDFNFADLEPMYAYLVEHGVAIWQLQLVNPMGNMLGCDDLIIRADKIPAITEFIREKNLEREMVVIAADSIGYFDDHETYIRGRRAPICCWEGCQAGLTSVAIDSVGNIKGCGALYDDFFIEGNVRDRSLSDIWNDETSFAYNRAFDVDLLSGRCRTCEFGAACRGGCRASNFFANVSMYESQFCSRNQCRSPSDTREVAFA